MKPILAPQHAEYAPAILNAHQYQGQTNDCAVISVAMVINATLHKQLDGQQLGERWGRLQWRGLRPVLRRIPHWAAFPWSMVAELREHGLHAHWHLLKNEAFLHKSFSTGSYLLPIIGSWKPLWAHVMVLVALDPQRGYGFANPAIQQKNIDWMSVEKFTIAWRAMGRTVVSVAPPQSPNPMEQQ